MFYQDELSKTTLFLKDTPDNRIILEKAFGNAKFVSEQASYLVIDKQRGSWRCSLNYEWLYRDEPQLSSIDTIINQ